MLWYAVHASDRHLKGRYVRLDSEKVRWHRDRLGWTLDALAEQAEVAEGTALRAEHGEDIRPSSGRRIARAFGVDISELIPEKPGVVPPKAGAPSTSGQLKGESTAKAHARRTSRAEGQLYFRGAREDLTEEQFIEILEGVRDGRITVEDAARQLTTTA